MTKHEVDGGCRCCPFAEKHDWSNEVDSGTDVEGCALGVPSGRPAYEIQKEQERWGDPPTWCKLREGPVLVTLKIKDP